MNISNYNILNTTNTTKEIFGIVNNVTHNISKHHHSQEIIMVDVEEDKKYTVTIIIGIITLGFVFLVIIACFCILLYMCCFNCFDECIKNYRERRQRIYLMRQERYYESRNRIYQQRRIEEIFKPDIFILKNIDEDNISINEYETCSICIEEFTNKNNMVKLPCGHKFHKQCISTWYNLEYYNNENINAYVSCPICRRKLENSNDFQITISN